MGPEAALRGFLLHNLAFEDDGPRWRLNLDAIDRNMDALTDFPDPMAGTDYGGPSMFVVGARSVYVQPDHHATIRRLFPEASILMIADAMKATTGLSFGFTRSDSMGTSGRSGSTNAPI